MQHDDFLPGEATTVISDSSHEQPDSSFASPNLSKQQPQESYSLSPNLQSCPTPAAGTDTIHWQLSGSPLPGHEEAHCYSSLHRSPPCLHPHNNQYQQTQQPTVYDNQKEPPPFSIQSQQLPAGYNNSQQSPSRLLCQQPTSSNYTEQQPTVCSNHQQSTTSIRPQGCPDRFQPNLMTNFCQCLQSNNSPILCQQAMSGGACSVTQQVQQNFFQLQGVPRTQLGLGHEMNLPIVNQRFCEPYPVELTVQKKACSLSGGDFTIFDPTERQVFRMSGHAFSCIRHKRVLLDEAGEPLMCITRKRLSCLHKRWDVFLGGGCDPGQLLCRTKRGQICKWICCHRGPVDVYNMAGRGKKRWDFRVTGSHQGLSRIYFGSRIIAEVKRRFNCCDVILGKDTLIMKVEAGVDQAFVTVLAVIMDVLSRNRGPQPKFNCYSCCN